MELKIEPSLAYLRVTFTYMQVICAPQQFKITPSLFYKTVFFKNYYM